MFEYWSRALQEIETFICLNRHCSSEVSPVSLLGLSKSERHVELHVLSVKSYFEEANSICLEHPITHRQQLKQGFIHGGSLPLWSRQINFGREEVAVRSSQGDSFYMGQLKANWLLAEALRQGWSGEAFSAFRWESLVLTSFKLDLDWDKACQLLSESKIELVRDKDTEMQLIEQVYEMKLHTPHRLSLQIPDEDGQQEVIIHEVRLCDLWEEMKQIDDYHRSSGNFSEEILEQMILQRTRDLEAICPQGMRLPVVIYEAAPTVSIQCYDSIYLDSPIIPINAGKASSVGIIMGLKDEFGSRGYPLKSAVIMRAVSPDTETIQFEVFQAHIQRSLSSLMFE